MHFPASFYPTTQVGALLALITTASFALAVASCGGGDEMANVQPTEEPAQPVATQSPEDSDRSPEQSEPTSQEASADDSKESDTRQTGEFEGVIFELGGGSEATFTVEEQLARLPLPIDAVMRTTALSGEVRFDGGESVVEIDLTKLTSDQGFRDRYVQTRMFGSHPVGVFTFSIAGALPDGFAEGETISTMVDGTLKMRGSEFPLSFDIEARDDGHSVFVLGSTQFTWEQFEIPIPTAPSVVWVAEDVRVQVLLELLPRTDG